MKSEKKIFFIGQQLKIKSYEKEDGVKKQRYRSVSILRLYKNFALCKVNRKYNKCFTYEELKVAVGE